METGLHVYIDISDTYMIYQCYRRLRCALILRCTDGDPIIVGLGVGVGTVRDPRVLRLRVFSRRRVAPGEGGQE